MGIDRFLLALGPLGMFLYATRHGIDLTAPPPETSGGVDMGMESEMLAGGEMGGEEIAGAGDEAMSDFDLELPG